MEANFLRMYKSISRARPILRTFLQSMQSTPVRWYSRGFDDLTGRDSTVARQ